MNTNRLKRTVLCLILFPMVLRAQVQRDVALLTTWSAPLYWQPNAAEAQASHAKPEIFASAAVTNSATDLTPQAQTPSNSLVFVGMTPCRIADTRDATFPAGFGPPSLSGGVSRTFDIQSLSSRCPVPSIAQAYSFNVTVVAPGFLDFITVFPTGQPRPNASTLNGYLNSVIANAAIVPAGTSGSVDVYASQNTNIIIDVNGYYAPQSGITLAQGTSAAPSLSFSGDAGTGISSSGPGVLNIGTGGVNRVTVNELGNVGIGTASPDHRLSLSGGPAWTPNGWAGALSLSNGSAIGWQSNPAGQRFGIGHSTGGLYFFRTASDLGTTGSPANYDMTINDNGNVGIGTTTPAQGKLQVEGGSGTGVVGTSSTGAAVVGNSSSGAGVSGSSTSGIGVVGQSVDGFAVKGNSNSGPAVTGVSSSGPGVHGVSTTNAGVWGASTSEPGVFGYSDSNAGVAGTSFNGPGLVARSTNNNLVEGYPSFSGSVRTFHITSNGTYVAGSDFAEALPAEGDKAGYEPGDVLVLSTSGLGRVEKTSRTYDERVAGVYSTRPGMLGAEKDGATRVDADDLPVAIIGVVPTKVSAESGPIQVGDLLTTSSTPGYAMRCEDRLKCFGATLGKAMEPLAEGKGLIKVLVTLR